MLKRTHRSARVALHELVTVAPDGSGSVTAQALVPLAPAVTWTVATNPPCHWLSDTDAVQPPSRRRRRAAAAVAAERCSPAGAGVVGPPLSAFSVEVYAAFLLPLPSKSSGLPQARHESLSRMPHTVMPVQRETARQAR